MRSLVGLSQYGHFPESFLPPASAARFRLQASESLADFFKLSSWAKTTATCKGTQTPTEWIVCLV